jgi:uncharacterized membrane protein YdjX (TVP38/TMEM64 family)/Fe-S oxidoreductase
MNSLETVKEKCIECPLCQRECRFLMTYGTPKSIAEGFDPQEKKSQALPFECSLCGLCRAVCPVDLSPDRMFLEMRRMVVHSGVGEFPDYGPLLNYEKRGTSTRYTYYGLPRACDTVFFPGCALPGSRPDKVLKVYEWVREKIPNLGMVLDCCTKPSHDLGREDFFEALFGEMRGYLIDQGIKTVLTACPNCHKVFQEYGNPLKVKMIYGILAEMNWPKGKDGLGLVTVHDPCVTRFEESVQTAVRNLIRYQGVAIEEMKHQGRMTLCCGEGGAVGFINPELAGTWVTERSSEAQGKRMLTYCAGCVQTLNKQTPTSHVLDMIVDPERTLSGKIRGAKAPLTYWNRLRLKKALQKTIPAAVTRERIFQGQGKKPSGHLYGRLVIFLLLLGGIAAIKAFGWGNYFDQEILKNWVRAAGFWAPLVYFCLYLLAPVFFIPGLPITIVGGLSFGPVRGVAYTIFAATAGACLAFLVSRYLARDWVEKKLRSPRWRKLDAQVESQGWKVVLITRLIPLFPFNLLNYAFGLTNIRFTHYALATFWGMLPACVAYIVFSSSLWDLLGGRPSLNFLIGLILIILISVLPLIYRKLNKKEKSQ